MGFLDCKWIVQLEFPRVIRPLLINTFEVLSFMSFSLHAGKGPIAHQKWMTLKGVWPWGIQIGPFTVHNTYFYQMEFHLINKPMQCSLFQHALWHLTTRTVFQKGNYNKEVLQFLKNTSVLQILFGQFISALVFHLPQSLKDRTMISFTRAIVQIRFE